MLILRVGRRAFGEQAVLELVEPFVELTRRIRTRQDALAVLEELCRTFGFREAVMLEYAPDLRSLIDYLDTSPTRRPRWKKVLDPEGVRRSVESSRTLLEHGRVARYDASRLAMDDPHRAVVADLDLLDGVSVPITGENQAAGAIHFSGLSDLSSAQEDSLHVIAYLLFASFRAVQNVAERPAHASLTPREKEVMIQSSLGHTSPEIAQILGLAERTVNQHIENVAYKFGTKNRLHTVANLLRLNLLD